MKKIIRWIKREREIARISKKIYHMSGEKATRYVDDLDIDDEMKIEIMADYIAERILN